MSFAFMVFFAKPDAGSGSGGTPSLSLNEKLLVSVSTINRGRQKWGFVVESRIR